MSKTIGVIGLGSIGMRHAKNLLEMGHIVFGYDIEPIGIPGVIFCSTINPVLTNTDGVVAASPTEFHLDHLSVCVEQKIPVLVEKPISDKWATAVDEMLAVAKRPVMTACNLRFHPCVKEIRNKFAAIGNPLWASFTCSQYSEKPDYLRDGVLLNWGAHEIDLALYFLGPAKVTAAAGDESCADVCLLHESGARSHVHVDYLAPVERRGFVIVGTEANYSADLVRRGTMLKDGIGMCVEDYSKTSFDDDYKDEMQAFIDLIDGKPRPEAATGADGLATLEIILEAKKMAGLT